MSSLDGDIVPPSGERQFDYSGSGLAGAGWSQILFGLFLAVLGAVMEVAVFKTYSDHPENVHGPIWLFGLFLAVILAAGVGILSAGAAYVRAVRNEKIVLTPTEVAWIDRSRTERARCAFSQIQHVEETVLTQGRVRFGGSAGYYAPVHHRCLVTTDAGRIVFSDNIADYERLKAFFVAHEPQGLAQGVFRYRCVAPFAISLFVFPVTIFMCYEAVKAYLNGEQMEVNHVMEQTPSYFPVIVIGISVVFWVLLGYLMLCVAFEKIVVMGGRLAHYGVLGNKGVDVPLTLVERGSYEESDSPLARGGLRYRVVTPQGVVKWSDQISGCTDLVRIMKAASNQSPLGVQPGDTQKAPGNPWY